MTFFNLILIGVAVITALAILGFQLSANAGKKAGGILKNVDKKYADFIERYLSNKIVNNEEENLDREELMNDVMVLLKPEIDGLLAHINATELSDVKIKYSTKFFQNALNISEELFERRNSSKAPLNARDMDRFYESFKDAIRADLTRRLLNLKAGDF